MRRGFSTTTKFLIVIAVFGSIAAAIWLTRVSGSTQIASTLKLSSGSGGLDNGLVGHWTFDGKDMPQGQVNDVSGNGNHGSQRNIASSTAYVDGAIGQALSFDRVNDNVEVTNNNNLDFGTGDFSAAMWIKANDMTTYTDTTTLVQKGTSPGSTHPWWTIQRSYGGGCRRLLFQISDGSSPSASFDSGGCISYWWSDTGWHHMAITIDRDGSSVMYRDGVAYATGDITSESGSVSNGFRTYIGANKNNGGDGPANSGFFGGALDDVRIYNRALSPDEIKHLYQLGATTKVATTPSQPSTGTGLNAGLVGHWTFDGKDMPQGQVNDVSGNANHGSQVNMSTSTAYTRGRIGQALTFDGTNDFISLGLAESLKFDTGSFSYGGWFWVDEDEDAKPPMGWDAGSTDTYDIRIDNAGAEGFDCNIDFATADANARHNVTVNKNIWYHVLCIFDANTNIVNLYVNGISVAQSSAGTGGRTVNGFGNRRLQVGSNTETFWRGKADDVRIYNRALFSDEIKQLYQLGATTKVSTTPSPSAKPGDLSYGLVGHWTFDGRDMPQGQVSDRSGQGNHGSQDNMATSTSYSRGIIGQALQFDGANDNINVGSASSLDNIFQFGGTLSLWIKPSSCGEGNEGVMVKKSDWDITVCASGGRRLRFYANFSGGSDGEWNSGANSIIFNEWQHVAVVYNSSSSANDPTFYVNGAASATTETITPSGDGPNDAANNFTIGSFNGVQTFSGRVDDVRAYNRTLTSDEIKQLFQMGR